MSDRAGRMYWGSLALFWGSTILATIVDFIGDRWLGVHWGAAPDVFPNLLLGLLLVPAQIVAGLLLLLAAIRMMKDSKTLLRGMLALAFCAATGALSFALYAVFMLFYLIDVAHRPL